MRACSVYNGLTLCRRRCFTIVAHNWKFWQMYFAWNIVLKLYMHICIVLWMYFLTFTPELSVTSYSSCLLYCLLEDFSRDLACVGAGGPNFYCTVNSMSACVHLKERAWSLSGEMHFLFISIATTGFTPKGLRFSPCPVWFINSPIYPVKWMKSFRFFYFELESICRMIALMIYVAFNCPDCVVLKHYKLWWWSKSLDPVQYKTAIHRDARQLSELLYC